MTRDATDQQLAQIVWDYMRYEQQPEEADVIIGLGCHDIGVARHAAALYREGYAPWVVFCGATGRLTSGNISNEADWYAEEAISLGVPVANILRERRSTNTGENIVYAYGLLHEKNIPVGKAIVVHKPYMLRRDYATIMKQWPRQPRPKFIFSAEQATMTEYVEKLESFPEMVNIMIGDLQRIREYPKLGFQIEQDIPNDVWTAYEKLVRRGYTKHLLAN